MRRLVCLGLLLTGCGSSLPPPEVAVEPEPTVEYRVDGNVSRPGTYRVPASLGLCGAIQHAGGVRTRNSVAGAFPSEIVVLVVKTDERGSRRAIRTKVRVSPSCVGLEQERSAVALAGSTVVVP